MTKTSPPKDLHYLVTRIINPYLNTIIALLRKADTSVVYYRDGTLDVRGFSLPSVMAGELEDWRDNLWYNYHDEDVNRNPDEILIDYLSIARYVYSRLYRTKNWKGLAENIKYDLIFIGQEMEKYLKGNVEIFNDSSFKLNESLKTNKKPVLKDIAKNKGFKRITEKSNISKENMEQEKKSSERFGICPRCSSYEGDKSEKKLYQCPYCGEWFCEKHVTPTLVLTFAKYKELWLKHVELREFLEKEWHRKDGHPCYSYTRKFWDEYSNKSSDVGKIISRGIKEEAHTSQKIPKSLTNQVLSVERYHPREFSISPSTGTWSPKEYTQYDNVIINVKKRLKEKGSVYVTPQEIYVETSRIKRVFPRLSSIEFVVKDGKRWLIIPEEVYVRSKVFTSLPENPKTKYKHIIVILATVVLLIFALFILETGL